MSRSTVPSSCLALSLLAAPALAQIDAGKGAAKPAAPAAAAVDAGAKAEMMQPPAPSKELEAFMKGMDGSWKCESKMLAGAMGPDSPEQAMKTNVKLTKEMGGMWYRGEWNSPKTKTSPEMKGAFMVGFEPGSKQAMTLNWDNWGAASMTVGTITGDTMTTMGDGFMMGKKMKLRETTTRGDKTMTHKIETDQGKGFVAMAEDNCKK